MVATTKQAFSDRLNQVFDERGEPLRGRRIMLARVAGVSGEAARKWLSGESIPAMEHAATIARHFNVSVQWLLTGQTDPKVEAGTLTDEEIAHIERLRCLPPSERARVFRALDAFVSPPLHDRKKA
jgi:transcriptional regulator with XRE-family HTH domain